MKGTSLPDVGLTDSHWRVLGLTMDSCARRQLRCLVWGLQVAVGERLGLTMDIYAKREQRCLVWSLHIATSERFGLQLCRIGPLSPGLGLQIAIGERLGLTMDSCGREKLRRLA